MFPVLIPPTAGTFAKCPCPKYLYIYKDGTASRVSAKTSSWSKAEKRAQTVRDCATELTVTLNPEQVSKTKS
jgi:hypothetical protein